MPLCPGTLRKLRVPGYHIVSCRWHEFYALNYNISMPVRAGGTPLYDGGNGIPEAHSAESKWEPHTQLAAVCHHAYPTATKFPLAN